MRVRILGAGVAGLSCALAMSRGFDSRGFDDVVVLERDTRAQAAERSGHGLILMQNGVAALRALGADAFLANFRLLDHTVVQDETGAVVESEQLAGVYCVTRLAIVNALRDQLPEGAVEYGRRAVRVDLTPPLPPGRSPRTLRREVRSIEFETGPPLTHADADLFVGAEGWRSPLYGALNPAEVRHQSAVFEIVTSTRVPELAGRLGSTFLKTVFTGRGVAFGLLSPTPDSVIGFLQFDRRRHGLPGPDLRAFVGRLLDDAPEPIPTYLRLADFATAHLWRPIDGNVAGGLCGTNAVIVGDAAHPLLPFTSQGVGAALEDGLILTDAVASLGGDIELLPRTLAGFADDRRDDMAGFVAGGRQILSHFVGDADAYVAPYVGGAVSKLHEHLAQPPTDLASLVALFDTDGDGHLTRDDLGAAVTLLLDRVVDESELTELFAEIADGGEVLGCDELVAAVGGGGEGSAALWELRRVLTPRTVGGFVLARRVAVAFRAADEDGDELIDLAGFTAALVAVGAAFGAKTLRGLFEAVDDDGDGRITQPQLLVAVRKAGVQR